MKNQNSNLRDFAASVYVKNILNWYGHIYTTVFTILEYPTIANSITNNLAAQIPRFISLIDSNSSNIITQLQQNREISDTNFYKYVQNLWTNAFLELKPILISILNACNENNVNEVEHLIKVHKDLFENVKKLLHAIQLEYHSEKGLFSFEEIKTLDEH